MVVDVLTLAVSHHAPCGWFGSIAAASATAPAALSAPAPWVRTSSVASGSAVYWRIAFTAFGGSKALGWAVRLASSIRLTTPVTTPAAMLVPLSLVRFVVPLVLIRPAGYALASVLDVGTSDTRCEPGATRSGFWKASYHVGPRELYHVTTSSSRVTVWNVSRAPTVMALGALPGDV